MIFANKIEVWCKDPMTYLDKVCDALGFPAPIPTKSSTSTYSTDIHVNTSLAEWLSKVTLNVYYKNEYYAVIFGAGSTCSVGGIKDFDSFTGVEFHTYWVPFSH